MYLKIISDYYIISDILHRSQNGKKEAVGWKSKETKRYGTVVLYFIQSILSIYNFEKKFNYVACKQFTNSVYEDLLLNSSKFF